MEKQREEYEKKALKAIYKAENEKAEAQSRSEYLQVTAKCRGQNVLIMNTGVQYLLPTITS